MKALTVTQGANWRQETFASASGDARRRASQLRKLGYKVIIESMGNQVTPYGLVKLSLLTILNPDEDIPDVLTLS